MMLTLRYRNSTEMIDWLSRAFGFEFQSIDSDADGTAIRAQLSFGGSAIVITPLEFETPYSRFMKQPDQLGGIETQLPTLTVQDCRSFYAKAKAVGAEIVSDLQEMQPYYLTFTCRDPEGHLWN